MPRRKPTELLKLRGTFNSTDHAARKFSAVAVGDLVNPPEGLTRAQRDIWTYTIQNAPRGILKLIDRDILRAWVEASARHRWAMLKQAEMDKIAEWPLCVERPDGTLVPSPYLAILDKTAIIMSRLANQLGFSPVARPGIQTTQPVIDGEVEADPWSALKVIPGGQAA